MGLIMCLIMCALSVDYVSGFAHCHAVGVASVLSCRGFAHCHAVGVASVLSCRVSSTQRRPMKSKLWCCAGGGACGNNTPTPEEIAAAFLKTKGVELKTVESEDGLAPDEMAAFLNTKGDPEQTMKMLDDGKMRPMSVMSQEDEIAWLKDMLANAQKEIAALNEKAAEERAGRADNLLKALLSAKGEIAGLKERLDAEREAHAAEIKALKDKM